MKKRKSTAKQHGHSSLLPGLFTIQTLTNVRATPASMAHAQTLLTFTTAPVIRALTAPTAKTVSEMQDRVQRPLLRHRAFD